MDPLSSKILEEIVPELDKISDEMYDSNYQLSNKLYINTSKLINLLIEAENSDSNF
jgi:hypothetical protein